jgi:hypothetical protein
MDSGTPGACIDLRGAWLITIDGRSVSTIADVQRELSTAFASNPSSRTLLFSHPEVTPDILNRGVPIMSKEDFTQYTHNQLNNCVDLHADQDSYGPCILCTRSYDIVISGNVRNYTTRAMQLTCGRLVQQDIWTDWQHSKYLQLNQYFNQGCFRAPTAVDKDNAVFHLVWTYTIKALNGRKKACCVCDGSSCSGSVKVLDEVYANCVNQTSSCLFYAIAAAKNLLVFGSDVCNAFAEAPPPKQGFFIRPD